MKTRPKAFCVIPLLLLAFAAPESSAQARDRAAAQAPSPPAANACAWPKQGSKIQEPVDLRSAGGVLKVELAFRSAVEPDGSMRYCYVYKDGTLSPTLRLHPGDTLILTLKNEAAPPSAEAMQHSATSSENANPAQHQAQKEAQEKDDPCSGGTMTSASTNLHFHGMVVPPTCHQDETIKTLIQPGAPPFEYRVQIPKTEPPGLYWYHPHPHGFSEAQVLGGASGALIVEGTEKFNREIGGLPERVLIVRDQKMRDVSFPSAANPNKPTKDLSINYVPVPYPDYPPAILETRPNEKEYWRVVNASADTFLELGLVYGGKLQNLGLVAMDGVPIGYDEGNTKDMVIGHPTISLPPAGRAEFIVTTPPAGVEAKLVTFAVERGPLFDPDRRTWPGGSITPPGQADQDDNDPSRPLAVIRSAPDAPATATTVPSSPKELESSAVKSLAGTRPNRTRRFYFSEELVDPKNPRGPVYFYITEEGHKPKVFSPNDPPDVVVHQGDVEDWIIENRTSEPHTFHIHQTHFLVVGRFGAPYEDVTLRDTVNVPFWNGFTHPYPSVKLRIDFRDPGIIGTFPFHCHILQHEDGGMMGSIRVEPAVKETPPSN